MNFRKLLWLIVGIFLLITGCSVSDLNDKKEDIGKDPHEIEENKELEEEEPIDPIKLKLEAMNMEEKIGQLLLVGMEGYEMDDQMEELIDAYHIGGIILYKKNVENVSQLVSLINSLKARNEDNKVPPWISVDEEGGSVSRMPDEIKKLPAARRIGKSEDSNLAREVGKTLGKTLKAFGYNMNFAPVLDIDSNPLNPVIGDRSFGQGMDIVSTMGIEVMNGMKAEGIIPVVKHFPGHGDTSVDSHVGLPVVNHDVERIRSFEMMPFKNAIDQGAEVVMVAHILMAQIDPQYPSSMSSVIIDEMLRGELQFNGVVITDDMTMGAIENNYTVHQAAIQSIQAGADLILVGHGYEKAVTVLDAIKQAVEMGNISMERIDESVYRTLKLKEAYELKDLSIEVPDGKSINENIMNTVGQVSSSNDN